MTVSPEMKTRPLLLSLTLLAAPAFAETPAALPSADVFYRKGLEAIQAGDVDFARSSFEQALRLDPNHANARYQLAELNRTAPRVAAKGREAKFGAVMLPQIQFTDAELADALVALGQMVEKESKGGVTANFIVEDPRGKLAGKKITLQLKNLPAKAVLNYLLGQAGAKARFDEHAIVVQPL